MFPLPFPKPWVVLATVLNYPNLFTVKAFKIHIIQIIIGDGSSNLGFNLIGPAFDVALSQSIQKYSSVFAKDRVRVTRYYVAGEGYSCAESAGLVIEGLSTLLAPDTVEKEFRVVLSPGCTFEVLAIADFAREANVAVITSVGAPANQDPIRFPTLLSLTGSAFPVLARAVAEMLKHFSWRIFNVLCDKNPDPLQISALEVFCGMVQGLARSAGLTPVEHTFNSAESNYRNLLKRTKRFSTVNVVVAYPPTCKEILLEAPNELMNTGEYIFFALPLSPFEVLQDLVSPVSRQIEDPFLEMLPYVLQFSFDEILWDAVANETLVMNKLSRTIHNTIIPSERQRNMLRMATFESFQIMAKVINETYYQLSNMSAKQFATSFYAKFFPLPSRNIKISTTGSRLCDINVKQFQHRNSTNFHEKIFIFGNANFSLRPVHYPVRISWPGDIQFPPDIRPICYLTSGLHCPIAPMGSTIIPVVSVSLIVLLTVFAACVLRRIRLRAEEVTWWIITEHLRARKAQSIRLPSGIYTRTGVVREIEIILT